MADASPAGDGPDADQRARRRKVAGVAVLGLPFVLLLVFAVGEGIGSEAGWWGHLVQLALVLLLAGFAWLLPRIGGAALIVAGVALATTLLVRGDLAGAAFAIALVCLPLVVSGACFVAAGRADSRVGRG